MSLPQASRALVESIALKAWKEAGSIPGNLRSDADPNQLPPVFVLAVRGYRRDSMGKPGVNDVGIWDDAFFLVTPEWFLPENANTDPSRLGWNPGVGKPFGLLQPGVWYFYPGAHKGITPAFRQADDATVAARLGIPHEGKFYVERSYGPGDPRNWKEWGHQQVNIHPGGNAGGTSSWLCQTLPKPRAKAWLQEGWDALKHHGMKTLPYILVEGPIN